MKVALVVFVTACKCCVGEHVQPVCSQNCHQIFRWRLTVAEIFVELLATGLLDDYVDIALVVRTAHRAQILDEQLRRLRTTCTPATCRAHGAAWQGFWLRST